MEFFNDNPEHPTSLQPPVSIGEKSSRDCPHVNWPIFSRLLGIEMVKEMHDIAIAARIKAEEQLSKDLYGGRKWDLFFTFLRYYNSCQYIL